MKQIISIVRKRWWIAPLVGILILAAYLRLHDIAGYMTFLGDEGRDVLVVKRIIVDHKFTLLGPTASVGGFFLGPIYYYFMLPFLWLWKLDPVGPAIMVALFGIATVYLVFKTGKDFFNPWVGLVAASVYAFSPVVIAYSRSSWNPNLVPFFATLLLYFLWESVRTKRTSTLLWIGVVLGIGLQLHYLFLFLFVVTVLWFIFHGKSISLVRVALVVLVGFLVGYAPFLAFEVRHGFPNTRSIIQFLFAGKEAGFTAPKFLPTLEDVLFRSFGRLVFRLPQGETWNSIPSWQLASWIITIRTSIVISIALLLAFVGNKFSFFKKIYNALTADESKEQKVRFLQAAQLLLLWLSTVVILFGFYRKGIYDYYFGILFSVPFLLVGLILFYIGKTRIGKWIAVTLWMGLLYLNWQGRPFLYAPNNQLAQAKSIAKETLSHTGGKPFNFALITGANSDHTYRYFFEIAGRTPVTIENDQIDTERKTVMDQLIVICEIPDCKPLGHPLWEIAGFGRAQIDGEWNVSFVKVFRLVHYLGEK